jgi:aspartate-semialdehyde dehydrogenase
MAPDSAESLRVAVVGATGAVGREMLRVLEERSFPVDELVALASSRSDGRTVSFLGQELEVRELTPERLAGVDVALWSAGSDVARESIPAAAAAGTVCIDNSSAFRMDPGVPLSIPEVNPAALQGSPRIVAVPNCTIITALLAVGPLHRATALRSLVLSSYQSVSGAGQKGIRELAEQVDKLAGHVEELGRPDVESMARGEVFGKPIAFNAVAKIGDFEPGGSTGEESKMVAESRKILSAPGLEVAATAIRVPVVVGHGVSILATFARPFSPDAAREILAEAPGVRLMDDPERDIYPSPIESAGEDVALVGRIRAVEGRDDALLLWSCADNLRKGAALDAVQIAEYLFTR